MAFSVALGIKGRQGYLGTRGPEDKQTRGHGDQDSGGQGDKGTWVYLMLSGHDRPSK